MKIKSVITIILAISLCSITGCTKNSTSSTVTPDRSSSSETKEPIYIDFPDDASVSEFKLDYKYTTDIEVTPEMNEKICSLMKNVTVVTEQLELAILDYAHIDFSNGSALYIGDADNYATYTCSDKSKSGVVLLPVELSSYLYEITNEAAKTTASPVE